MPNELITKESIGSEISKFGRILSVIITLLGSIWYFGEAPFKNKIHSIMDEYVESKHFESVHRDLFLKHLESDSFEKKLDTYISENNSNQVSFRKVLSIKMEVPEESVAGEMANLYIKDKERLLNVLRLLTKEYPNSNLWEYD
jgi:hypothetical protein